MMSRNVYLWHWATHISVLYIAHYIATLISWHWVAVVEGGLTTTTTTACNNNNNLQHATTSTASEFLHAPWGKSSVDNCNSRVEGPHEIEIEVHSINVQILVNISITFLNLKFTLINYILSIWNVAASLFNRN